jgi:hypothetical protein
MLVLGDARLVFLATPKTASQAIRAMLQPHAAATPAKAGDRHIGVQMYERFWARHLTEALGGRPETFAVIREPIDRLGSWYRYRQRDNLRKAGHSTAQRTFEEFIAAKLLPNPPAFARFGRQDRFVNYTNGQAAVDHVFDYARLDLLLAFLAERIGAPLQLPKRNKSPVSARDASLDLSADLEARLRAADAPEFQLYDMVRATGVLRRR